MNSIVASQDSFVVYTNLSRVVQDEQTRSSLTEASGDVNTFSQRGLAWVTALARVELSAMLAGFTETVEAFAQFPPTRLDLPAYKEMLLDGARTHYLAMRKDPVAQLYWQFRNRQTTGGDRSGESPLAVARMDPGSPLYEPRAIAYARRAVLAQQFAMAYRWVSGNELTTVQHRELSQWETELATLQDTIVRKVLVLGSSEGSMSGTSSSTTEIASWSATCPALIRPAATGNYKSRRTTFNGTRSVNR